MSILRNLAEGNESWSICRYKIGVEIKFSDGKIKKLHESQIQGLFLEKDFDSDHLPVFLLDISLSRIDEDRIDSDTEFKIRIKQYYLEEEGGEKKNQRFFLNDTFVKLDFGKKPDTSVKIDKKIRELNDVGENDVALEDLLTQKTYPLIKKKDLLLTKKIVNGNLSNVSQLDIFAWALTKAKCKKDILISNFTNGTKLKEINIRPKGLLETLISLEREYGWHKEGTYLFMDFDIFYIIRMNGVCTAWQPSEQKKINLCINETTSEDNVPGGVLVKSSCVYYNIGSDQYDTSESSDITDHIEGNNMILIDTGNGSPIDVESGITSYGETGSYNARTYHGHNPYIATQYKRRKREQEHQIKLTCVNGDISYLTPNKEVAIITDVTSIANKFRGRYRLSSFKAAFIKNGETFDNSTEIVIKRVSKN